MTLGADARRVLELARRPAARRLIAAGWLDGPDSSALESDVEAGLDAISDPFAQITLPAASAPPLDTIFALCPITVALEIDGAVCVAAEPPASEYTVEIVAKDSPAAAWALIGLAVFEPSGATSATALAFVPAGGAVALRALAPDAAIKTFTVALAARRP